MASRTGLRSTITDVARASGVSEATVSYYINGKRALKADTRERVARAMRELNYHPSAVARGLASKKVHTLGILLGAVDSMESMTNSYSAGLLRGIVERAQKEGFNLTIFTAPWVNAQVSAPALRDGRTDGILAIAPPITTDIVTGLASLEMPLVVISGNVPSTITNVDVDNEAGLATAATHLISLGHRRIGFLMGDVDLAAHMPRRRGFERAHWEAGLQPDPALMVVTRLDGSTTKAQLRVLMDHPEPPTAICCGNDTVALAAIEAAHALGFSVPGQLSIIGFDDVPEARHGTPALTTMRQPLAKIGDCAAQLLIEAMQQEAPCAQTITIEPDLVVRGTTAPPL